jgi:hypothetical protein
MFACPGAVVTTTCRLAPWPENSPVTWSISSFARITIGLPSCRSNGPTQAGLTIERPNGAPPYVSVRYTFPPVIVSGSAPSPTLRVVSPTSLSGPQVPAFACASGQSFTPARIPERPGDSLSWTDSMLCSPSSRPIVAVSGS